MTVECGKNKRIHTYVCTSVCTERKRKQHAAFYLVTQLVK